VDNAFIKHIIYKCLFILKGTFRSCQALDIAAVIRDKKLFTLQSVFLLKILLDAGQVLAYLI
jgi:hypothetical protein